MFSVTALPQISLQLCPVCLSLASCQPCKTWPVSKAQFQVEIRLVFKAQLVFKEAYAVNV